MLLFELLRIYLGFKLNAELNNMFNYKYCIKINNSSDLNYLNTLQFHSEFFIFLLFSFARQLERIFRIKTL